MPGLDHMLNGGFIEGRSILLTGPCGTGKTTIAMQYAYFGAVTYKENTLYVTLEEAKSKIYQDMATFGFDLKAAEHTGRFFLYGGPLAKLSSYMDKVDASVSHLIKEIELIVKEKQIKRVVIDSINLFLMLLKDEDDKRIALASLANALSKLGCTTLFISEVEESTHKLSRHGIEEFIVDGVVVLFLVREGSRYIPGISIRKMRGTNHDKEVRVMRITEKGVKVYPDESMYGNVQ